VANLGSKFSKRYRTDLLSIFRITFPESSEDEGESKDKNQDKLPEIFVEPFVTPNRGPYPYNQPKR
jgi:intron-binding protein aquarius